MSPGIYFPKFLESRPEQQRRMEKAKAKDFHSQFVAEEAARVIMDVRIKLIWLYIYSSEKTIIQLGYYLLSGDYRSKRLSETVLSILLPQHLKYSLVLDTKNSLPETKTPPFSGFMKSTCVFNMKGCSLFQYC